MFRAVYSGRLQLSLTTTGSTDVLFSFSVLRCFFIAVPHLSVDDKYQSPRPSEDHLVVEGWVEEVNLTREVPNLEVDEGAAGDVVLVDLVGTFKEQGLIGRHFVEHHLKSDVCSDFISMSCFNRLPSCTLCHVFGKIQPVKNSSVDHTDNSHRG